MVKLRSEREFKGDRMLIFLNWDQLVYPFFFNIVLLGHLVRRGSRRRLVHGRGQLARSSTAFDLELGFV